MRKKIKAKQYALLAPQFVKSLLNDRLTLFIILSLLVSFALSLLADLTSFVNNAAQPVQFILPFFHLLICIWLYLLRKKQEPKYFKYLLVFYQIARIVLLVALVLLFLLLLLFGLALLNSAGVVNPENSVNPYQLLSFI
ncbi:MAG: hypothetical protein IJE17_06185, partial [Clostridia bacterium]|nr:hypothetical protein [Clostridia bacterium]